MYMLSNCEWKEFLFMTWMTVFYFCLCNNSFALSNCDQSYKSDSVASPVDFVSSYFENGSPLFWDYNPDGSVKVRLLYDHERSSPNRASNHWHFRVHAKAGSEVTIVMDFFHEVWNGRKVASYSLVNNYFISGDGKKWKTIAAEPIENVGHKLKFYMDTDVMYVSGMEPYRISDLEKLLAEISGHKLVDIQQIGKTVEGRQLEIIRVGKENAPFQVFIRARAHPWEAGGNWVVQGLVRRLLENDKDAILYLDKFCVYILPMANKDGVARGMTRFNTMGKDLNRELDRPADPFMAPENYALETWFKEMSNKGKKFDISIDIHNDRNGRFTVEPTDNVDQQQYNDNARRIETLMYKYTWYTWFDHQSGVMRNGENAGNYKGSRYDVPILCTFELNQTWIAGLNKIPFGKDWELMGRQLCDVFFHYFNESE